jgi:hypothetical protein
MALVDDPAELIPDDEDGYRRVVEKFIQRTLHATASLDDLPEPVATKLSAQWMLESMPPRDLAAGAAVLAMQLHRHFRRNDTDPDTGPPARSRQD